MGIYKKNPLWPKEEQQGLQFTWTAALMEKGRKEWAVLRMLIRVKDTKAFSASSTCVLSTRVYTANMTNVIWKGAKDKQTTWFRMVQGWQALQDSETHLVKPRLSPLGACPAGTTGKALVCWWHNQVRSLDVCSALRRFWCSSHRNSCDLQLLQADIIFSFP